MQYLECLATALPDMAFTFQPAASMSIVLQAVMMELHNASAKTPPPEMKQFESVSIAGTRRESSGQDTEGLRTFKQRQLSKSSTRRAGVNSMNSSAPSTSCATSISPAPTPLNPQDQSVTPSLSLSSLPFASERDVERQEGYVLLTPRSERAAWPTLDSNLNALDYPMTTFGSFGNEMIDGASM